MKGFAETSTEMKTTLFDILDRWTLSWDLCAAEIAANQMSDAFYGHGVIFFVLERLWDILEAANDPSEFMTPERASSMVERLLRDERVEAAATFVLVEMQDSPSLVYRVLNVEEAIARDHTWFESYRGPTLSETY
ncbi:MAG: hypothetical protein DRP09_09330 [Candidatus Thorarchaeota archaeon]|nr:MAG: hypothetical protein DRP09_09330 [Candidatus Thorarchaeota archaeon]